MTRPALVLLSVCFLALPARAATTASPAAAAARHFDAGSARQLEAELAATKADARRLYLAAIAEYAAAAALEPDHCQALALRATCASQLISLATSEEERLQFIRESEHRFAGASQCPGAEPLVFEQWCGFLIGTLYDLTPEPAAQLALLRKAAAVARQGLQRDPPPTARAQLERHLGSALMWQVDHTRDPQEKRDLLEQAITHLRAASDSVIVRQTLYQNGYLGIALMSLGRLVNDPARFREAVADFEAGLRSYPYQVDTHYNLAAAWSLLGDADQAGKHLAVVVDQDASGAYARQAEHDPDLAPVRQSAAYRDALDRRRRQNAEAEARALFSRALRAQQTAERTNHVAAAVTGLRHAVALYEQAIGLTPDHYAAQALCATALAQLANLSRDNPDAQRPCFDAARQRFAAAAACTGVEPQLYDQWSTFLLAGWYPSLAAAADKEAALREARAVLEEGIRRARFSGLRGRLESQLGTCLVLLAQEHAAGTNALPLYTEAVRHFRAAEQAETVARSASYYELWGIALLRSGQPTRDPHVIRQAVERLAKSLEVRPDNPTVHYNLACAYSQLRQYDQAMRHLEASVQQDPRGVFYTTAEKDPDLEGLRRTEPFQRFFRQRPRPGAENHPTVSEQ